MKLAVHARNIYLFHVTVGILITYFEKIYLNKTSGWGHFYANLGKNRIFDLKINNSWKKYTDPNNDRNQLKLAGHVRNTYGIFILKGFLITSFEKKLYE